MYHRRRGTSHDTYTPHGAARAGVRGWYEGNYEFALDRGGFFLSVSYKLDGSNGRCLSVCRFWLLGAWRRLA
jgi:hypothetical protein